MIIWIRLATFAVLSAVALDAEAQLSDAIAISEDSHGVIRTNASVVAENSWRAVDHYLSVRGTCEFLHTEHFTLSANLRYSMIDVAVPEGRVEEAWRGLTPMVDGVHHVFSNGVNLSYRTKIGPMPFFTMGMLTVDFSPRGFEHVGGVALAVGIIKGSKESIFGIGLVGLINGSTRWPIYPAIVYTRRLSRRLAFSFLGAVAMLDYTPGEHDKLSVGADLDVKKFYFRGGGATGLPVRSKYQKTTVRPQIKYRHTWGKRFYVEGAVGVALKISSSVGGATGRTKFFDVDVPAAPFVRLSGQYTF